MGTGRGCIYLVNKIWECLLMHARPAQNGAAGSGEIQVGPDGFAHRSYHVLAHEIAYRAAASNVLHRNVRLRLCQRLEMASSARLFEDHR
jgi:hypothetical protein